MIRVTLSGSWTASAAGIAVDLESRRRGSPICALARKLVEAGHSPATELHVYRGATLCFRPAPLGKWAGVTVAEGDNARESARFVKFSPGPEKRAASIRVGRSSGHPALPGGRVPEAASAALAAEGSTP